MYSTLLPDVDDHIIYFADIVVLTPSFLYSVSSLFKIQLTTVVLAVNL